MQPATEADEWAWFTKQKSGNDTTGVAFFHGAFHCMGGAPTNQAQRVLA
jgi:hypothetical protein